MYLEIDEGFPKHRKTLRLRSIMRDPKAGWYMVDLWTWACRSCPSGDLTGISAYEIEEAANYPKCDGKLCQAMIDSDFIDADESGSPKALHNWMLRTGAAIGKMAKHANSKKLYRAHKDGKCDRQSCEWCKTVQGQSKDSPRTVARTSDTDQTSPDQSSPDQTSQEDPPSRDPGTTGTKTKTAHDWLTYFGVKYWEIRKRQYGRGTADAKAMSNFGDLLDSLPVEQRAADWEDRERIVTEFLNRSDARTVSAGWPFCFFATDFRGLAMPADKRPNPDANHSGFRLPPQAAYETLPPPNPAAELERRKRFAADAAKARTS
jgi:hypothetical protein